MLIFQVLVAAATLLIGRKLFYSFVRKDLYIVLFLRYVGYIGLTILSHFYLGNFWTWIWVIGLPLLGLFVHTIFVRMKGFRFLKPGEEYDEHRGWKE